MQRSTFWLLVGLGALLLLGGSGLAVYAMTRGLRNNNPGNIKISGNAWQGKIPPAQNTDGTFEQFTDMAHGLRALDHLLDTYSASGYNTVDEIIRRFSATDQEDYVRNVADALDVHPDDIITVADPNTKFALVRAIIKQEQGTLPAASVPDDLIYQALAMA